MVLEHLKIVELGNTKIGKTTYMASMYGNLQSIFSKFKLRAVDQQEHDRLLELYSFIRKGKYPAPTSQRNRYDFVLQYREKDVLSFNWTDYRGEAVRDKASNEDVQALLEDLRLADGIMVFFSAIALIKHDKRTNEIGRINYLLGKAFVNLERPISLAIVLTQVDLIGKDDFQKNLLEPIKGLIELVELTDEVSGVIIPTACGTKMINTRMPVVFALQTRVRFIMDSLSAEYQKYKEEAASFQKKADEENSMAGGIRDLWRWFIGETTHGTLAQQNYHLAKEQEEKAQAKLNEWQPLVEPINNLDNYTRRLVHIRKGESLQNYATQCYASQKNDNEFEDWLWFFVMPMLILVIIGMFFLAR